MSFRTWSTGDSVSAADFTSYIASQCVLVFTNVSARTSAISSPVDGMVSLLTGDNIISIYDGSAWVDIIDIDTLSVSSGNYTISGSLTLTGGTPIVLEGATADAYETSIAVTDPTADRTITLPNVTGTVITTGNPPTALGTLTGGSPIVLEGATADAYETTIAVTDPTADRTITLPDATGTVALGTLLSWSGSTANGLATYGSSSSIVAESTATYDGTTLALTGSGGGLKFASGLASSDANTMDDYEEGTFDVTATVASGTLTVDTDRDTLKYTKIGNRVFIMGQIEFTTASTPSGAWSLSGLPFTNTNTGSYSVNKRPYISTGIESPATDIDPGSAFGWIEGNSTTITMYQSGVAATGVLNANHIDTGTHIFITGQYVCDT